MYIRAYRVRGHLRAKLDPLGLLEESIHPELDYRTYGFSENDLDRPIFINDVLGLRSATLREITAILEKVYCSTIGVEFMHISEPAEKAWMQERIEGRDKEVSFTPEGKRAILRKLIEAEGFENFLHRKYPGTKRFGLDGGEATVPAMEAIIKRGGQLGVAEIIIGMPHRGRLNVLANVMSKPLTAIFSEFQGTSSLPEEIDNMGDVKYHLGASSDREFDGNRVHLSLAANPSHLEAVDPVVLGKVRATQALRGDTERKAVLPVLLHGDAAFYGQGLVAECFNLSGTKGHRSGGTIHIVVNNQVGFTTSPQYTRTSPYPSDVAKMVQAPIFHVNGDDPEAVTHIAKIATEFRQQFSKDVVIDMFCYRRHGHNEGDDPTFTQPLMYKKIKEHKTTPAIYAEQLVGEQEMTADEAERMTAGIHAELDQAFEAAEHYRPEKADWLQGRWSGIEAAEKGAIQVGQTAVELDVLRKVGTALTSVPDDFNLHKTLKRLTANRIKALESGEGIDWATGEALAYGSLMTEGYSVRLSGQDCGRGTFSQRHSVWVDQENEHRHVPLNSIPDTDAEYEVLDSMLSEMAVLGFEYGYSMTEPDTLTLWEAQFGDFANGAQVIIDQFIAPGEAKWLRMSGLVMLLPHGYEGQGPEHSSGRLERFLQLCGDDNMQVVNCSTPASYFHVLRRQMHRKFRKPLVVMTPKSLLRHKRAVSSLIEMGPGTTFHRVLWDDAEVRKDSEITLRPDNRIQRVVLCTGKIYYDLYEERERRGVDGVYILRLEQLYPFPLKSLIDELGRFPQAEIVWCQEEPKNMGAWHFIEDRLETFLRRMKFAHQRPVYVGRRAAASPATGIAKRHATEQAAVVDMALTL
jgi:2-oxoglutarate dehydrogenase E1 component